MSERTRRGGRAARDARRRSKRPVGPIAAGVVIVLLAVVGVVWAAGAFRGASAPAPKATLGRASKEASAPTPVASEPTTPATQAYPGSSVAESTAAVRAAALPYPNPPAVAPMSFGHTKPSRKLVAITLDDGIPFDTKILDLLESKNVRCTTFLLGQAVKAHPDLVRRLDKDGFEIANHTWDHKNLAKLSEAEIRSELKKTQDSISAITGNQAPYLRPPGGATDSQVKRVAASMGYRIVLWNVSFADTSKYATPEKLYHNVMDNLKPGDIILCHWGAGKTHGEATYEALKLILPEMEKRGFTPVTISELLRYSSPPAGTNVSGR